MDDTQNSKDYALVIKIASIEPTVQNILLLLLYFQ
jgi:hypothetical protein